MSTHTKQWSDFNLSSEEKTVIALIDEWSSRPKIKADEFESLRVKDLNIMVFDNHEFCMDIETTFGHLLDDDFISKNRELRLPDFVRMLLIEVM